MTTPLEPGHGLIFMKVGTHANEPLEDIIRRKAKEIEDAGIAMWGYGGGTCHPLTMVQPFARDYERRSGTIYLCMHPMTSRHFAPQKRATEYSADGLHWEKVPDGINVLGSRYALVIRDLAPADFDLPLSQTRVALGRQRGRAGDAYVTGHVDKACLEVTDGSDAETEEPFKLHIGLTARLVEPYAVFVRNTD